LKNSFIKTQLKVKHEVLVKIYPKKGKPQSAFTPLGFIERVNR
jgi:hypothetical protein